MSHKVTTTLTILASQREQAEKLFGGELASQEEEYTDDNPYYEYSFDAVNWGNLQFLPKLRKAGIAYTSRWEHGNDFSSGAEYLRFTEEGEAIEMEIYDTGTNPDLDTLLDFIDQPERLREYILEFKVSNTPLPLDSQQEINGQRYLTRSLIDPSNQKTE